jgi:2-C-methyl-D-erythritol 4-phosphate cytidylyltransferase
LPCAETVKRSLDGVLIAETLDRQQIWLAQTPQVFAADLLIQAHQQAIADGFSATDDAMLVERMGVPVRLVVGEPTNLKVTYPADLLIAEAFLRARKQ